MVDFDTADQGANDLAPGLPVGGFQPVLHLGSEVLQASDQQLEFGLERRCVRELTYLLVECREALSLADDARLELLLFEETLGVAVDQARQSVAQFGALQLEGGLIAGVVIGRCQPLAVLLLQAVRLLQECARLAPDRGVQQISADLVVAAHAFAPESVGRLCRGSGSRHSCADGLYGRRG